MGVNDTVINDTVKTPALIPININYENEKHGKTATKSRTVNCAKGPSARVCNQRPFGQRPLLSCRDSYHKASSWPQHQLCHWKTLFPIPTQDWLLEPRTQNVFKGHEDTNRLFRQAKDKVETEGSIHWSTVATIDHGRKAERRVQVSIPTGGTQEDKMHNHGRCLPLLQE